MSRQTRSIDGFHVASLRSAMGHLAVATAACRVVGVTIGHRSAAEALARVERMLVGRLSATRGHDDRPRTDRWTSDVAERLVRYLAGEETSLVDIPIDVSHLSPFQQRVVAACRGIPRGRTSTYGTLAVAAGAPGAARAVGQVMASNRFPLIVPCHRVVAASGGLGGFSAPQGVVLKQRLLAMEGALTGLGGRSVGPNGAKARQLPLQRGLAIFA